MKNILSIILLIFVSFNAAAFDFLNYEEMAVNQYEDRNLFCVNRMPNQNEDITKIKARIGAVTKQSDILAISKATSFDNIEYTTTGIVESSYIDSDSIKVKYFIFKKGICASIIE